MPERLLVARELAAMLNVLSHPCRLAIVEELGEGERDVNSLQEVLGISHSGVSQHLAALRAHRLVAERREGRHVFYRLRQPRLAPWLLDGLNFMAQQQDEALHVSQAIATARARWGGASRP